MFPNLITQSCLKSTNHKPASNNVAASQFHVSNYSFPISANLIFDVFLWISSAVSTEKNEVAKALDG